MKNKRKKSNNSSQVEIVIFSLDLIVAVFAGIIYYSNSYFTNRPFTITVPSLIIWINIIKIVGLYLLFINRAISSEGLFRTFVSANLLFLTIMAILASGSTIDFYPLYFLVILVAIYRWDKKFALLATSISSVGYAIAFIKYAQYPIVKISIHIGLLWGFYIFAKEMANRLKNSQEKLMNAMDNLNHRTWELEIAQGENEIIYDTVAHLAGTIDVNEVKTKILKISTKLLDANNCSIYKLSSDRNWLYLLGEADSKGVTILKTPKRIALSELFKFISTKKPDEEFDHKKYGTELLINQDKSEIVVPLAARSSVIGYIFLGSSKRDGFTDIDRNRFQVMASAAALALDNAYLLQKTEEMAIIDELTSMYNYRYFRDKLQTEINRAMRYNQVLSILMIDIDFFKKVNDNYGHQAGNLLLQQLSGLFRRCIREVDIIARYGGEEFVIILPETSGNEALNVVAERIRSNVENTVFECGPEAPEVKITVSIGLSQLTKEFADNPDLLLESADRNLYAAKNKGRNRIVFDMQLPIHDSIETF
ncbi:MAG: GGDEF domain-containing protein [candidate division Zixibacteria bacterium]|nr:GGDEF domain-containing protein [candidate division Zixibacteria bacterium]